MNTMMTLGDFQFSIATAAFQELTRNTEWRWAAQDRFLQLPALQFVGPGGDTITLPGVIYPEYRGGIGQLDAMRALAGKGQALTLVSGTGNVMGQWVIERIEEKQSIFAAKGVGRKQEFTLEIRKFDDPAARAGTGIVTTSDVLAGRSSIVLPPLTSLQAITKSSGSTFTNLAADISSGITAVRAQAGYLTDNVSSILRPMNQAMAAATGLSSSITDARRLLGSVPSVLSGKASARSLLTAANNAVMNSGAAGSALKNAYDNLTVIGAAAQVLVPVQSGLTTVNRMTVAATSLQQQASSLLRSLG